MTPDTKPDERDPLTVLRDVGRADLILALTEAAEALATRAEAVTDQTEATYVEEGVDIVRAVAKAIPAILALSSSPPEGEDTQRLDWLEQRGGYVSRYNSDFEQWKGVHWETHNMGMNGEFYGGTARDAIDSARAAIPPQNSGHE